MTEQAPPGAARPLIAAGALFLDDHGAVLLVNPSYKGGWEIPGGYVEAGESPLAACRREVKEELGITPSIGGLLAVDWAPHPDQGDKLLFIFDGGHLSPAQQTSIRLAEQELTDWRFCPASTLDDLLIPRLARRVHACITTGTTMPARYLEHGAPLPD
jgi:8-oxo-dGTP diphosphatase